MATPLIVAERRGRPSPLRKRMRTRTGNDTRLSPADTATELPSSATSTLRLTFPPKDVPMSVTVR